MGAIEKNDFIPKAANLQGGVFTVQQAIAAGLSPGQAKVQKRTGRWQRVAGRGWCGLDQPIGSLQAAWALHLTWPDAVIWGPSALALWLTDPPLPKAGVVFGALDQPRRPSFRIQARHTTLDQVEVTDLGGLLVQSLSGATADTLVLLPPQAADSLFAWTMSRNQLKANDFSQAVSRRERRIGAQLLRRYLKMAVSGAASPAELELHMLLEANGLIGWQANKRIELTDGRWIRVDLAFENQRVVIEVDGWAFHSSRDAFSHDRSRDAALQAMGYRVLRFTWDDITNHPTRTVGLIQQALSTDGNHR
ncbi:MAG: endonuclease domain-containing protein [Micrococcales bacterium]|nr:endonuclease domain-containing protein [Micrococcales bacterium]